MKPYWWSNPSFTQQYRWECWTLLRAAEGSTLKFPCFHLCSLLSIHCQYDWIGFGIQLNCCTSLPISHFLVLPFWIVANVHPYLRIWLTLMFFPKGLKSASSCSKGPLSYVCWFTFLVLSWFIAQSIVWVYLPSPLEEPIYIHLLYNPNRSEL